MGLTLLVESNCAAVIEAASVAFGGAAAESAPDMTLVLDAVPGSDRSFEPQYDLSSDCATVRFEGVTRVVIDRARSAAEGIVSQNLLADAPAFRYHVLQFVVASMLARHGMMGVHAAACVRGGLAILLRGPGGSGKTTLAYAAARAGWQALSESVTWIDTRRGQRCWGMPRWFHFPESSRAVFADLPPGPTVGVCGRERIEVDLEAALPGSMVSSAEPAAVVFVDRTGNGESRVVPLDREEAVALWPLGAAGTEAEFPGYEREVLKLLDLPAYRMQFGSDLTELPALLERIIEAR